jgi:hypothetical protein
MATYKETEELDKLLDELLWALTHNEDKRADVRADAQEMLRFLVLRFKQPAVINALKVHVEEWHRKRQIIDLRDDVNLNNC